MRLRESMAMRSYLVVEEVIEEAKYAGFVMRVM